MLVTDNSILPLEFGFGAGSAAVIVPDTVEPAGITTRPVASFTSWLTVAVYESPTFAERVLMESLAVAGTRLPAASISGAGFGAAGFFTGVFVSVAGFAASVAGAGTSFRAAVDSVGASVRLRAVESADWLCCSPCTQAASAKAATVAASRDTVFRSVVMNSLSPNGLSLAPNIGMSASEFPG